MLSNRLALPGRYGDLNRRFDQGMQTKSWLAALTRWPGIVFLLWCLSGCGNSSYLTAFISDYQGSHFDEGVWSPDSRWFAAATYDDTTNLGNVYLYAADGTLEKILKLDCYDPGLSLLSWLPDGRISCIVEDHGPPGIVGVDHLQMVEVNKQGQPGKRTVFSLPIELGALISSFQWNPRHLWLALIAATSPGSVSYSLYLSDAQGHALLQPIPVGTADTTMAWSPDGKLLALTQENGDITLLSVQQEANGKLTLTQTRSLQAGTSNQDTLTWSPSGKWLVCRHGTYTGEDYLFLLAADGSGKTVKLTSSNNDGQLANPNWSPDGKQLIVEHVDLAGGELLSLNIEQLLKEKHIQP
jgi:Tol biopolymer transport system component